MGSYSALPDNRDEQCKEFVKLMKAGVSKCFCLQIVDAWFVQTCIDDIQIASQVHPL